MNDVIRRCRILAECTEEPGHITRTFLSPPMREVHRLVRGWMEEAGLRVWIDAAGNIRGTRGDGPRVMIASHLDTVPHAGAFDGILGVMIGIELARAGVPIEVVGFSEEEGVRFATPFIGSRALVGDPVTDPRVLDAIRAYGLDPAELPDAVVSPDIRAYLEFHIEQGPVLDLEQLPVAVVEAIAGQSRYDVTFQGKANHVGTTPMDHRADALAAAAEWISAVERCAQGVVATVGCLEVEPNASNVIPGRVRATLDVRSASDSVRLNAVKNMLTTTRPGITFSHTERLNQAAVPMDPALTRVLADSVQSAGFPVRTLASGAGHDAMILAHKVPAAMLFLRSPGGMSHHPDETVLPEDVEAALAVGRHFLENWRAA